MRRVVRAVPFLFGLLLYAAGGAAGQSAPGPDAVGAATITAEDLRVRIGVLADDSMRGRDTPSPELRQAAEYVATKFRTFGLRPGAGEDYLQTYPLTLISPGAISAQRLRIRGPEGEWTLDPEREFIATAVGGDVEGEGPLVAVWSAGAAGDVRGKVILFRATADELQRAMGSVRDLVTSGGAAGVLLAVEAPPQYLAGVRSYFSRSQMHLGEPEPLPAPVAIVPASALPPGLGRALRDGGALEGWTVSLRTDAEVRRAEGINAIGWLEGSDPRLKAEYVLFTAHMDHVGVGHAMGGDSIYNGADDNASGTAAIIELAQAFASLETRPRRSLVFMTVSGEEKGLWGSRWYAENPAFPLERTVANLNMDMIGRNWEDTVVVIGKEESSLGEVVERAAREHPELGMAVIDDPWPEERFYFRSDHYNFARKGVPILFFFSGVHEDYHRPSDEAGKIDYAKTARIGRLIYHTGLEVANDPERPRWDSDAYRRVVEGAGS